MLMRIKLLGGIAALAFAAALFGTAGCEGGGGDDNAEATGDGAAQFAGNWSGTYGGEENGTWSCSVDASGSIRGTTRGPEGSFSLVGTVSGGGDFAATAGDVTTGASFSGRMTSTTVSGTWRNPYYDLHGTFSGNKR